MTTTTPLSLLPAPPSQHPPTALVLRLQGVWKMGAGSEVLGDGVVIADVMGPRFEGKWLMQLSLFPKKKNEQTGEMESTFETIEEWVPPPPEEAWDSDREREIAEAAEDDD